MSSASPLLRTRKMLLCEKDFLKTAWLVLNLRPPAPLYRPVYEVYTEGPQRKRYGRSPRQKTNNNHFFSTTQKAAACAARDDRCCAAAVLIIGRFGARFVAVVSAAIGAC